MAIPSRDKTLNLARKWRPRTFDEIVGQDTSVKMLKNALYLGNFFPVYIFSGERGCGKTTTARIFAAALNCQQLAAFRSDPQSSSVPCQTCDSCLAMLAGSHPDFVEIDAASHTGVDNVRSIIESAAHLPLAGSYKVYLIDEAHMLSKAAFNAFLKMLEEPPPGVCFMLATTELDKVPDTVRSRTFQLFFPAVALETIEQFVIQVAAREGVTLANGVAGLIAQEARGSLRDGINTFERIRFCGEQSSLEEARKALGQVNPSVVCDLLAAIVSQEVQSVYQLFEQGAFTGYDPVALWHVLLALMQDMMRRLHGVHTSNKRFLGLEAPIKSLCQKVNGDQLRSIMALLWDQEPIFLGTNHKLAFLEHLAGNAVQVLSGGGVVTKGSVGVTSPVPGGSSAVINADSVSEKKTSLSPPLETMSHDKNPQWEAFVEQVVGLRDPVLQSIFGQAVYKGKAPCGKLLAVQLGTKSSFFDQKIADSRPLLEKILRTIFNGVEWFVFTYKPAELKKTIAVAPSQKKVVGTASAASGGMFADKQKWPNATMIQKYFPGRIEKDRTKAEDTNETVSS